MDGFWYKFGSLSTNNTSTDGGPRRECEKFTNAKITREKSSQTVVLTKMSLCTVCMALKIKTGHFIHKIKNY